MTEPAADCDWPGCEQSAIDAVPMLAGMSLSIDGVSFEKAALAVCAQHAPRIARLVLEETNDVLRRHAARANLAPGDAEWNEYFGDE
jgi:hypothetical protein